jgi:hypothetical protein
MARLNPTLLVVPLLLTACASSKPASSPGDAPYLQAVNSDYSTRTDQVQSDAFENLRMELPESLVAGNQDMTVAAAMFVKDDYFTVDLVIHNHSGRPLEISRGDMYVMDYMGARLEPLSDWDGAENYGLRSMVRKETEYAYLEGRDHVPGSYSQTQDSGSGGGKASDAGGSIPVYDEGAELDMLTEPVQLHHYEVVAPPIMTVQAGQKRPYWAYFTGEDVVFPVSVVVRMDGKRLIFRFEEPKPAAS